MGWSGKATVILQSQAAGTWKEFPPQLPEAGRRDPPHPPTGVPKGGELHTATVMPLRQTVGNVRLFLMGLVATPCHLRALPAEAG